MGAPLMSSRFSGMSSAPPSMGLPMPSNTLPSISGATASSMEWPRNFALESVMRSP